LWAPRALGEPRLLTPGQLDYPSGLLGQQQRPARRAPRQMSAPETGSCQRWERVVLGSAIEQPLVSAEMSEDAGTWQAAGEYYLEHLWTTHSSHFGNSRPTPALVLTDELRADTVGQYLPGLHLIKVRPKALTRHVLAHECCHAWTTSQHDAAFAAGMLYLLQREFGCELGELLSQAHALGLQIGERSLENRPRGAHRPAD
jgi:hypothetical protein